MSEPQYKTTLQYQQERLSVAIFNLSKEEPFFFVLLLLAQPEVVDRQVAGIPVKTACTDGRRIYMSQRLMEGCSMEQIQTILKHEVLHVSNLHSIRGRGMNAQRFNLAADYWINGLVDPSKLPQWTLRAESLEHLSTEEIYAVLRDEETEGVERPAKHHGDLMYSPIGEDGNGEPSQGDDQCPSCNGSGKVPGSGGQEECPTCKGSGKGMSPEAYKKWAEETAKFWQQGVNQAAVVARQQGKMPLGMERMVEALQPTIDWRTYLWNFIQPSNSDFNNFDRRILDLVYTEMLEDDTVEASVAVDTSGSISEQDLAAFMGEIRGILGTYPKVKLKLFYADAEIYGPYEVEEMEDIPMAKGFGGTDFRPFFKATENDMLRIYLTDGYGSFPSEPETGSTLWVVMPGGLQNDGFPFGEVVRMAE